MTDTIRGHVTRIIDGSSFDIDVRYVGVNNQRKYGKVVRVRLANIDVSNLDAMAWLSRRSALAARLRGKEVRCFVHERDDGEQVIATVAIVNSNLAQRAQR
jgi:endonuclease YncB( thermonuclease family)